MRFAWILAAATTTASCASIAGIGDDYVLGSGGAPTTSTTSTTGSTATTGNGGSAASGGQEQGGAGGSTGGAGVGIVDSLQGGDALLVYGSDGQHTPWFRVWHGMGRQWDEASETAAAGQPIRWVVTPERLRNPLVVGVLSAEGTSGDARLDILAERAGAWAVAWSVAGLGRVHAQKRGFDLEHESSSGDLMIVFAGPTGQLSYRTLSGGAWSPEGTIPALAASPFEWLDLVARPGSDELTLLGSTAGGTLHALVWDGDGWGTAQLLEQTLHTTDYLAFGAAYESASGDLVAVWGHPESGAVGLYEATMAAGSGAFTARGIQSAPLLRPGPLRMRSEPGSDRVAMAYVEFTCGGQTCDDFIAAIWDGDGWQDATRIDEQIVAPYSAFPGAIPVDLAWVSSGEVVAVYTEEGSGLDWARWRSGDGWQLQTDWTTTPALGQRVNVQAARVAGDSAALFLVSDDQGALYGKLYEGGVWMDLGDALAPTLSSLPAVPFALAMRR